jgi:hypothetical protein
MKHLLMLLQIFIRGKSEFSYGAVGEGAVEGPVMTINMLFARLGVLEAFMEVEAGRARTLEVLVAVESGYVFGEAGRVQRFKNGTISHDSFAE